jgi:hypothetical protein
MGVPTVTLGTVKGPHARPRLAGKEIDKESMGRLFTAVAAARK